MKIVLRIKNVLITLALIALAVLICMPVVFVLFSSIKDNNQLFDELLPLLSETGGQMDLSLLPIYPTLKHYKELLIDSPQFYTVFFNSVKIVGCILVGQLFVAAPAAWAFARFQFPFKKLIFTIYIVLMLMPFQVTMLPNYLVLNKLRLLDTQLSVILPGIFSTFPVFIMYRGFREIPKSMIEAAMMDGAGEFTVFFKIGIPLGSSGILSALVLGFLDGWNMVEQPLAFIKEKSLWPLSLYLPEIDASHAGIVFAASVITLIPAAFVFAMGREYLEQGIVASGVKE